MNFDYQAEKFSEARRALMLPHPRGEEASIAEAFHAIERALYRFDTSSIEDSDAIGWIRQLEALKDTSGLTDETGDGLWTVKARQLSTEERLRLSQMVDELAHWFDRKVWGNT
jgi:hypothetical protein